MSTISPRQLAPANYSYARSSFDTFLDDVAGLGVEHIEVYGVSPHVGIDDVTPSDVARIAANIQAHGLKPVCFTPEQVLYPVNIAAREDGLRKRSLDYFAKAARIAADLGSPKLFLTTGWGYPEEDLEVVFERSVQSLSTIVVQGAELGLTMVIETLQPIESRLANDAAGLKRVIDAVGSPHLLPALDTVAMSVAGETPKVYRDVFGAPPAHVHLIDGTPAGHVAWGDGNLPLASYLEELEAIDYTGFLAFEIAAFEYWNDPLAPIVKTLEAATAALQNR